MVKLTINGRQYQAKEGMTVLEAAQENNIHIPTLCNMEAILPYGACRLCLVEITTARGRERLVTSCIYQVEEGLTVQTNTERDPEKPQNAHRAAVGAVPGIGRHPETG